MRAGVLIAIQHSINVCFCLIGARVCTLYQGWMYSKCGRGGSCECTCNAKHAKFSEV